MRTTRLLLFAALNCASACYAQNQSIESIREIAENFLRESTVKIGELASISVGKVDSRLKLKPCEKINAFLPPGSKAWGKITVGVKCSDPNPWQIFLSADVRVIGDYYVAASNLNNGQVLSANEIVKIKGELSNLPNTVVTNPNQVVGKTIQGSYSSGVALRTDMFRSAPVIQQGQTVKVISYGKGFQVSTEATALNNANEGQLTRVKTNNGQFVAGIAKLGGIIEIQN